MDDNGTGASLEEIERFIAECDGIVAEYAKAVETRKRDIALISSSADLRPPELTAELVAACEEAVADAVEVIEAAEARRELAILQKRAIVRHGRLAYDPDEAIRAATAEIRICELWIRTNERRIAKLDRIGENGLTAEQKDERTRYRSVVARERARLSGLRQALVTLRKRAR